MSAGKTTQEHERAGTFRQDRHGARPEIPPGAPDPPEYISAAALQEWNRVVNILVKEIGLCPLDRGILAAYSQSFADIAELTKIVAEEGHTIKTADGVRKRNPAAISLDNCYDRMFKCAAKLGLSPRDRTKPVAPSPESQPDIDAETRQVLDALN